MSKKYTFKTVDAWVHALNEKARKIEEEMHSMHPSAWLCFAQDNEEYRALAQARILEDEQEEGGTQG